jgi:hypothetical protein
MRMRCKQVLRIMPAYLIGDLSPTESREAWEHIEECPTCAKEEAALRRILEWTDSLAAPAFPEQALPRVRLTIENAPLLEELVRGRQGVSPTWRVAGVACLLAALGLGLLLVRAGTPGGKAAPSSSPVVSRLVEPPQIPSPGAVEPSTSGVQPRVSEPAQSRRRGSVASKHGTTGRGASTRLAARPVRSPGPAARGQSPTPSIRPSAEEGGMTSLPKPAEEGTPPPQVAAPGAPPSNKEMYVIRQVVPGQQPMRPQEVSL